MGVLITGAGGFIGSNLVSTLLRGGVEDVTAVLRRKPENAATAVTWVETDVARPGWTAALPKSSFEAVVHLAQSRHFRDFPAQALDIFNVNVHSTFELADWSRRRGVKRFVFASTGNVYGSTERVNSEEGPCEPDTLYGASKLAAEILLKPFGQFMDVVLLRLFGVYGPEQANAMLPGIIQRFHAGEEIVLAGNVGVRFNPIYVDDCTALIGRLTSGEIRLKGAHALNVCGPEIVDLRRAVDIMERQTGTRARVRVTADAPKQLVGSTDKLAAVGAMNITVPFQEGFARTLAANPPRTTR